MPALLRIDGFTTIIYAIVKNVVSPAISSVEKFVPRAFSLNIFSISIPIPRFCLVLSSFSALIGYSIAFFVGSPSVIAYALPSLS